MPRMEGPEVSELTAAISRWQMKHEASDYALAKKLGCSPNTPMGWRAGRSIDLTPERADAIAELLGITVEEVLILRGFNLGGGGDAATVGPSPRWANRQNDATQMAAVHTLPVPA